MINTIIYYVQRRGSEAPHAAQSRFVQMSKKIFVGGLSWDTDDAGLTRAFEQFGDVVDAKVITERDSGRSRGFGFVTFSNTDAVTDAIDGMNGSELDGRRLNVDVARERTSRNEGGGGGDRW